MTSNKFTQKMKSLAKVTGTTAGIISILLYKQNDEKFFGNFLMPISRFLLSQESRNKLGLFLCKWGLIPSNNYRDQFRLSTNLCGIELDNCLGLAAGFDRNGEAIKNLHKLGFSFVEVGTITPEEIEKSNSKPMKYADEELARIRYDPINKGHAFSVPKMRVLRRREEYSGIVGFNIGKNSNSTFFNDISLGVKVYSPVANYLVINIESESSINPTENLKLKENLRTVLQEVNTARLLFDVEKQRPIFLKLSPELNFNEVKDIVDVTKEKNCKVHGFIISNSTVRKDINPGGKHEETVSSADNANFLLREKSTQMLKDVYKLTNGKSTLIGVGEISSGKDAYEKILAGASAIQIYSSFLDQGPPIVQKIKRELNELLIENGYENVSEAVGKGVKLERRKWFGLF